MKRLALLFCLAAQTCDSPDPAGRPQLVDVTEASGIRFEHVNGASGSMYFSETNGSGTGFFDYDNDGDQDLYVVQAGRLPGFQDERPLINRLYRNDGDLRFVDVTDGSGLGDPSYGMGCLLADFDGDGWRDVYVYNWGPNVLFRNNGDGTFSDVTAAAGVGDPGYGGAAVFADFDRDGDLDLFVGNYVEFTLELHRKCSRPPAPQSYCHPDVYDAQKDLLYRNNGDGTFTDVSAEAGITREDGKALGAVISDIDGDGDVDLFVANDSTPNFMYRNDSTREQLRFVEDSSRANVAYDRDGRTQGCMGCDFGDIDGDLDFDLVVTNLGMEANALYINAGGGVFEDSAFPRGIGRTSVLDFGWGTRLFDFDFDTDLDLLVLNGHLHFNVAQYDASQRYAQQPRLFLNRGDGRFDLASAEVAGPFAAGEWVGRGLASADLDDDGDLDFFANTNDHPARLIECRGNPGKAWLGVELLGKAPNRDAIGARLKVTTPAGSQVREVRGAGSFCSYHDPRLLFGLGEATEVTAIEVAWPDGTRESFGEQQPGKYVTLAQGGGEPR